MTNYRKTMAEALIEVFAEELSPDEIAKEQSKAIDQFNDDMAKEFPKEKFTARANVSPLGGGIAFEFGVIPAKDAKGVDLLNAPAHSKFMMHLTDNKNRAVPMSKFSVEHIMGRLPVKFRKVTGKSPTDAVKKLVDWFKKNKRDFEGLVVEEVELGEATGKEIAAKMMKDKSMKAFASKVAKMKTVSRDDLEKMLPDYVAGAAITKLFEEVELDEGKKETWMKKAQDAVKKAGGNTGKMDWDSATYLYNTGKSPEEAGEQLAKLQKEEVELDEGYEKTVLLALKDEGIKGHFRNDVLYVAKRDIKDAKNAIKDAGHIKAAPKIMGEEVELDEALKKGAKVEVPHKGKRTQGTVVRYVPQRGAASPYYVVYVGEYGSIEVPAHKIKEEVELDEREGASKARAAYSISKLPPHLAKFFDKDGNLKRDAADRIAKGREKFNIKDVTPKGYGPKEEVELDEANYEIKNGKVHISKKEFAKVSKDYKGKDTMTVLDPKTGATVNMPVVFEEVELDEVNLKQKVIATIKDKGEPDRYGNPPLPAGNLLKYIEKIHGIQGVKIAKKLDSKRFEEIELDEGKFQVKTATSKKGKITVTDFDSLDDAKKHLAAMEKKGQRGIISQDGKLVKEEVELDEFTKKDYDENEDNNMHTENAIELARKFGTSKEYDRMVAIYKAHRKRGSISSSDQKERDALVKKYLPKLKEEVELDEGKTEKDILIALKKEKIGGYFSGGTLYVAQRVLETVRDLLKDMKLKSMPKLVGEEVKKEARQLKDPKKEVMVVKGGKVIVINKKDAKEYLNKGWKLAEEVEPTLDFEIKTDKGGNEVVYMKKKDYLNSPSDGRSIDKDGDPTISIEKADNEDEFEDLPVKFVDESSRSDALKAMRGDPVLGKRDKKELETDIAATADDKKAASKNIIYQLMQVLALKGSGELRLTPSKKKEKGDYSKTKGSAYVEFSSGKKEKVDRKIAREILSKYVSLQKPIDKQKFQAKIAKSYKDMLAALKESFKEEVELDEKITRDQTYFKTYSDAVSHALKYTKDRGYEVDEDDFHNKVTTGPRKPSEGKTVSQRIDVTKDGKSVKKQLSFQVYNKGGNKPYELNVYVEEVELDEGRMSQLHAYIKDGKDAKWIAKKMGIDVKTVQSFIDDFDESLGEHKNKILNRIGQKIREKKNG